MTMEQRNSIISKKEFSLKRFFLQWEWMLVLIFIIINIINANLSPYYLDGNVYKCYLDFFDKAFMVLPMTFVILLEIGHFCSLNCSFFKLLYE